MSRRRADPSPVIPLSQGAARLVADADRPQSWTLVVNGTPQSHVDLADPTHLEFEYVRWFGHVADTADRLTGAEPAGSGPLNVLHLGGGAWTLARYVAATRPGSRQRVVEIDAALVDVVRARLPSAGTGIRVRIGDARQVLATLAAGSVDLLVVDVFAGARIPAHLTSVEFVQDAARVLRPGGTYAANLADGAPLAFARGQAATVAAVFSGAALVGSPQVLRGRGFGNLVLVGTHPRVAGDGDAGVMRRDDAERWLDLGRRCAADPFRARVVTGDDLSRFVAGAAVVTDADAVPSPAPPAGLMGLPD